ncbi:MAG: anti-sigma factor antagonist [Candidatus Coproplasma sp.]
MKITEGVAGGVLYLKLVGEMDEYSAQAVRERCDKLIESNATVKKIVINLSQVEFMDSTGIGFLIGRYKKAAKMNIPLYVEAPNSAADKILNLSGIYTLIPKAE